MIRGLTPPARPAHGSMQLTQWALLYARSDGLASVPLFWVNKSMPMFGSMTRALLFRSRRDQLPQDRRLPLVYRVLRESGGEPAVQGELARDTALALVEAALLAADEPLTPRRLATVAGLADATEARRLVRKLQTFYDKDDCDFNVAQLAVGFQSVTLL